MIHQMAADDPPPEMAMSGTCRRFSILDSMILVAASSVWLLWTRTGLREVLAVWERLRRQGMAPLSRLDMWWVYVYGAIVGAVGLLTVAFLAIRLRRPRPALRGLIWQPGMMACSIILAYVPLLFAVTGRRAAPTLWLLMSASVAASWTAARLAGRLRPEPGWIDRLGRVLGTCWIVFAAYPLFLLWRG